MARRRGMFLANFIVLLSRQNSGLYRTWYANIRILKLNKMSRRKACVETYNL